MDDIITTEEMLEIIFAAMKREGLRPLARRIGIRPETLLRAAEQGKVHTKAARYFGFKREVFYTPI